MQRNTLFSAFFTLIVLAFSLIFLVFFGVWAFWRRLTGTDEGSSGPVRRVSLFGAPASHWWIETYERILWWLEDLMHVPFYSSPEGLFTGSLILGGVLGFIGGQAAFWLVGWSFWKVFFAILLLNVFSAWLLARPARGWWELNNSREEMSRGGFILGRQIDE